MNEQWTQVILTVAGVAAFILVSRLGKLYLRLPKLSPWLVLGTYNGLWALAALGEALGFWRLPSIAAPVGLVGGNALLVNWFGLPSLKRTGPGAAAGAPAPDPDRQPLIPRRRKKPHHKRR